MHTETHSDQVADADLLDINIGRSGFFKSILNLNALKPEQLTDSQGALV